MSRMMGIVSRGPVYYELFEEFADLATKGMGPLGAPDERGHQDGWGLVCFQDGELRFHEREVGSASGSSKYFGVAWRIAKLNLERKADRSLTVLGHLLRSLDRAAIPSQLPPPLLDRRDGVAWAFQHDGSLVRSPAGAGRSDAQFLFGLLLDALQGRDHEAVASATRTVRERTIQEHGGFTSLNFMLTDGGALHVYRDFQANGQYYTLFQDNLGEMIIAASEPILGMAEEPLPRGVLHTIATDLVVTRSGIA